MDTELRLRSGADGWRGVIGETFTPRSVAALAGCVVRTVARTEGAPSVLVTSDGRRGGARAAQAVAAAATAAGGRQVRVVRHLPTPTATHAVRSGTAGLALLVTASHNPPRWNGLKVKAGAGAPLPSEAEREADALFARRGDIGGATDGGATGGGVEEAAPEPLVAEHVAAVLAALARAPRRRLRVVVDGLGGIAGAPLARLCSALGWEAHCAGCVPDPDFGGGVPDPSLPRSRRRVAATVREREADLGLVLDGDGDRVYAVDHRGRTLQPPELMALLLTHHDRRPQPAAGRGVAVTASTGMAVRRVAELGGDPVLERPIGFKHLSPLLASGEVRAAGGSVGDVAFAGFGIDRDPFAAVALLADLLDTGAASLADHLDELRARVGSPHWFESRVEGAASDETLAGVGRAVLAEVGLAGSLVDVTHVDGAKLWLAGGQWILLRTSSTEGGVRVYGELADGAAGDAAAVAERLVTALRLRLGERQSAGTNREGSAQP